MVARQEGSGFANASAAAIEEIVAATLRGDEHEVELQQARLEFECEIGRCGMSPTTIVLLIRRALTRLGLDVADAFAQPLDGLGDVRASLRGGGAVWFEVKAQTKKERFSDLTQADWVRDQTDLLRWVFHHDRIFANRLPGWVGALLEVQSPSKYFAGWNRDSLWLADMALLVTRDVRQRAGVRLPTDLPSFLTRKFVLHLTREGIRIVRLDRLVPVAAALNRRTVAAATNYNNQTAASVAFACPGPLTRGAVHFTYHLGYPTGVIGRHKMHAISLDVKRNGIEVRS